MKVHLNQIPPKGVRYHFDGSIPWIYDAVSAVDEAMDGAIWESESGACRERRIEVEVFLQNLEPIYLLKGELECDLALICSAGGLPFCYLGTSGFSFLILHEPTHCSDKRSDEQSITFGSHAGLRKPRAQANLAEVEIDHSFGHSFGDLEQVTISERTIDLDAILREQVQLLVPAKPLCCMGAGRRCPLCIIQAKLKRRAKHEIHEGRQEMRMVTKPFQVLRDLYKGSK